MTFSLEQCIMFSSKVGDYIEKYLQAGANKVLIVDGTRPICWTKIVPELHRG